jgi:hypothetical protein
LSVGTSRHPKQLPFGVDRALDFLFARHP